MVSVESTLTQTAISGVASVSAELTSAGLETAAANATSFFGSASSKDFLRAPLHLASHLERSFINLWNTFKVESLGRHTFFGPGAVRQAADTGAQVMADAAANAGTAQALGGTAPAGWAAFFAEAFQASTFKSYWGMLHYITSRWAFTVLALALILNRIGVYGAARQRIYLDWPKRLALRIVPILLFISQIHQLLQAIRCQTSPDFSLYRHGNNNMYSLLDWSKDGGALHTVSSAVLFGSTDASACAAVGLSRPSADVRAPRGSFSLLWPSFLRLSLSNIVESLSCSLQQIPATTEVGMTVFEHSLAFAEAETALSHTLGLGPFGSSKPSDASSSNMTTPNSQPTIPASGTLLALADATASLTGPHILDRVNVPVEVLLVTLLSCGNSLTSHVLAVMGKQRQWRLVNTGIWGMAFMSSFVWGLFSTSTMVRGGDDVDDRPVSSLLHFPTVAIVGFLPHMAILLGIGICFIIYLVALTFTAVSLGTNPRIPQPTSLKERFSIAHDNLQAAIQTRGIHIRWYEDFYTALLRVGFAALTAASESVFLNEGRAVEVRQFTWIEEDRLDEFEGARDEKSGTSIGQQFQILEEYGLPSSTPGGMDKGGVWESGYFKERKFDRKEGELEAKDSFVYPTPRNGGVGAVQRTTRFYLLMIYLRGILFLIAGYVGFGAGVLLDSFGITGRPRWLRRLVGRSLKKMHDERNSNGRGRMLDFWLIAEDGKLTVPLTDDIDIEPEMRRRLMTEFPSDKVDDLLDSKLYDWWRSGGWFGLKDGSGDYQPPPQQDDFDDTTSVISTTTEATTDRSEIGDEDEDGWESEPDGTKTPTQTSTGPTWSFAGIETRESTPFTDTPLDTTNLARLLDPQDRESRDEARILAAHLKSVSSETPGIMTRSRYQREMERERARILLAGRTPQKPSGHVPTISLFDNSHVSGPRPLTNAEEAEVLESLILSRRKAKLPSLQSLPTFDDADDESHRAGPACVYARIAGSAWH
ncbi:hypothetical protein H2204_001429 [Knufia peltigerae]|uniref:Uncharacterized protein n=1 Tax=Knufia peltigerae TaxID=1002370 RepID=A0AA38YD86_9EURO|nr:hypothetical protein H2204_001429 [Knufia peltigerae]